MCTRMNKYTKTDSGGRGCERVHTHRIDHFNICVSKNVSFAYAKKSLNKEKADPGKILPPLRTVLAGERGERGTASLIIALSSVGSASYYGGAQSLLPCTKGRFEAGPVSRHRFWGRGRKVRGALLRGAI